MSHYALDSMTDDSNLDWVHEYTAAMTKKYNEKPKVPGPHSCAVCCTFFSAFGALFLFCLSGLMRADYAYLHMPGDVPTLSKPVAMGGIIYIATGVLSIIFWVRGSMKRKAFEENLKRGAINEGSD